MLKVPAKPYIQPCVGAAMQSPDRKAMSEELLEGCLKEFCMLWHDEENQLMALRCPTRIIDLRQSAEWKIHCGNVRMREHDKIQRH